MLIFQRGGSQLRTEGRKLRKVCFKQYANCPLETHIVASFQKEEVLGSHSLLYPRSSINWYLAKHCISLTYQLES